MPQAMRWDVLCRVVDNLGDVGVCSRLARQLAARGHQVRLWIDDASALAWMHPEGLAGVTVHSESPTAGWRGGDLGEVVLETFGCGVAARMLAAMLDRQPPPVWVNLEHLSAEGFVERSHRLPSPRLVGAGAGLTTWFFYPGFTPRTGGLVRETGLLAQRAGHDAAQWLETSGLRQVPDEPLVCAFAYPDAPWTDLAGAPALRRARFLLPGARGNALSGGGQGSPIDPADPRWQRLPLLSQDRFDRLLWSCTLNLVRGEDSFVRAQWAGIPFLWQPYRQSDLAHRAKLEAFLDLFLQDAPASLAGQVRHLHRWWNGMSARPTDWPDLDARAPWATHCRRWRDELARQDDLVSQLTAFVKKPG